MESKARILDFKPDLASRRVFLQVELENVSMDEIEGLESLIRKVDTCKLTLTEYREPRTLSANKYFHVLADKLADSRRMSKSETKNYLLYEYGQKWRDEEGNLVCIKTNAPRETLMQAKDFHVWDAKPAPDGTPMYVLLRHSSSFNTKEMSILIDGVISECKEQGIETLSPDKIRELKEKWNV